MAERSRFLGGTLLGLVAGAALGAFAGWERAQPELPPPLLAAQAAVADTMATPKASGFPRPFR